MTPNDLYTLLGLGMSAGVVLFLLCYAALGIPRVWRAAAHARAVPALAWLAGIGLLVYVLWPLAFDPPFPVYLSEPIVCSRDCGWALYYVIVVGALRLLAGTGVALSVIVAAAVIVSVRAWWDKPVAPGSDITNGVRLRSRWRIRRLERDVITSVTTKIVGDCAQSGVRVTRQSTRMEPITAVTSMRIDPAPESFDEVTEMLKAHPLVDSVDISCNGQFDGGHLLVHWDLPAIDTAPTRHAPRGGWLSFRMGIAAAAVAVVAVFLAVTSPQALPSHTSAPMSPPALPAGSTPPPDQLVPFTMSADACRPHSQAPDECGPDGRDGQLFTLDIDGPWMIHQVGFNPSTLVPGRVVSRVRWSFGATEPAGTVFEQDIHDPSHSPELRPGDPQTAALSNTFVAFLRTGGYLTSAVTVTVLDSTPAPGVDPSAPVVDDRGDRHTPPPILMYGRPTAVVASEYPAPSACGSGSNPLIAGEHCAQPVK